MPLFKVGSYNIYPNNGREMWIDVDFIVGPPLFSIDFWYNCLKLKNSYTTRGRIKQIEKLKKLETSARKRNIPGLEIGPTGNPTNEVHLVL